LKKYNNNYDTVVVSWNPNSNFTLNDKEGKVWPMELINWGPMSETVLNQTADALRNLIPFMSSAQVPRAQ
jgi:hypothetical protein